MDWSLDGKQDRDPPGGRAALLLEFVLRFYLSASAPIHAILTIHANGESVRSVAKNSDIWVILA